MRDYQRKKNNGYLINREAWHTTLWIIRGYHRYKDIVKYEANTIKAIEYDKDHVQTSNDIDTTYQAAVKLALFREKIDVIDTAIANIPGEYQKGVWESVLYGTAYPQDADRHTYGMYKARFIHEVADRLNII